MPREGFDLYYRTVGLGNPVILLAGGPGVEVGLLGPVADALGKDFACILLEQRGTGRSLLPSYTTKTLNLDAYVADLEALREHLQLDRLTLLGNSWGMMLSLAYAAAHPERVQAIVTAGSGPVAVEFFPCFEDSIAMRLRPEDVEAVQQASKIKDPEIREFEQLRAIMPCYFFDHDHGVRYAREQKRTALNRDAARLVLNALKKDKFDLRPGLRKVTAPVLLLQGRQDPAGEGNLYEAHQALSNSRLQFLERCGHLPWVEQPKQFYDFTRSFLKTTFRTGNVESV